MFRLSQRNIRGLKALVLTGLIIFMIKVSWTVHFHLSGEKLIRGEEKQDLLERRRWLLDHVATPAFSPKQMPSFLSHVYQQEWAIGTLSMTAGALANLAFRYPETREESAKAIAEMIERLLQPDVKSFEEKYFGEDALSTLHGNNGHAGFLGHLNYMLGAYRFVGGDSRFEMLHHDISVALARRILQAPSHSIETFPGQIFIPDNAVVVASLVLARTSFSDIPQDAIDSWLSYTREHLIDSKTGILRPWIGRDGHAFGSPRGSYAAWTIYYLNWIDKEFAHAQYRALKSQFAVSVPKFGLAALREYEPGTDGPEDLDSGPVLFGLSTVGTGFMIAGALLNSDGQYLQGLLTTAEVVGSTWSFNGQREYLFAPIVGEAIMLSMLSATDWDSRYVNDEISRSVESARQSQFSGI